MQAHLWKYRELRKQVEKSQYKEIEFWSARNIADKCVFLGALEQAKQVNRLGDAVCCIHHNINLVVFSGKTMSFYWIIFSYVISSQYKQTNKFTKCGVCVLIKELTMSTLDKDKRKSLAEKRRVHNQQQMWVSFYHSKQTSNKEFQ